MRSLVVRVETGQEPYLIAFVEVNEANGARLRLAAVPGMLVIVVPVKVTFRYASPSSK